MSLRLLIVPCLGALMLAGAAFADEAKPGAGRYSIAPSASGFIRLDTVTGAISHCAPRNGVWFCDVLSGDDRSAEDRRIADLKRQVDAVTIQLARMAQAVAALDGRLQTVEAVPRPQGVTVPPANHSARQGFGGEVVRRFILMVREMKGGEPAGS